MELPVEDLAEEPKDEEEEADDSPVFVVEKILNKRFVGRKPNYRTEYLVRT